MPIVIASPRSTIVLSVAGQQNLKLVFLGTPSFVVPVLRSLAKQYSVVGVITAPDRIVGRKKILTPSAVKVAAQELSIPVVHTLDRLEELKPDLCIVAAYNKIIPDRFLQMPRLGYLNIHPSLLPAYRGPSPVRSAILDGVTDSAVSIMLLDKDMDHGPILSQQPWHIPTGLDAPAAEQEAFRIGSELLIKTLPDYISGTLTLQIQDHTKATYSKKFTREDGRLDFTQPAQQMYNRIRALADNPGTWTVLPDGTTLNILAAHLANDTLVIEQVQPAGGTPMSWEDFLRGHPGTKLG